MLACVAFSRTFMYEMNLTHLNNFCKEASDILNILNGLLQMQPYASPGARRLGGE